MKKLLLLSFLFCFASLNLFAQYSENHKKVIATYQGFPPTLFEAPDVEGKKHFLPDYKDKVLVLFFWNLTCEGCKDHLSMMNAITNEFKGNEFQVIGLADEGKEEITSFTENSKVSFPVIANGKGLGEMGYALELGYPRAFVIDKFGIIQKVVSKESENFYGELKKSIEEHLKN